MKIALRLISVIAILQTSNILALDSRISRSYDCQDQKKVTHYRYRDNGYLDRTVNWDSTFVYYYDEFGRPFEAFSFSQGVKKREERFVWTGSDRFDKYLWDDSVPLAHGIIINRRKNSLDGDSVWQFRRDSVKVGVWRFHWNNDGLLDSTVNEWLATAPEVMQRNFYKHISKDSVIRVSSYGNFKDSTCFVDIYEATSSTIIKRNANKINSISTIYFDGPRNIIGRLGKFSSTNFKIK